MTVPEAGGGGKTVAAARPAPAPSISVIVPVRRGGEDFGRCLDGIARLDPPPDEVIVVADGEPGRYRETARARGFTLVEREATGGPAAARNQGARRATGDLLLFVDADVVVHPDVTARLLACLAADPGLAAVFGSYDDAPADPSFLSQYKNLLHHWTHQRARPEASTFWGACGAVRREAFFAAGGFDEDYPHPAIEDIEFGYRLRARGGRIYLCREMQATHLKHWGPLDLVRVDVFRRALPWTALILRDGRFVNDLNTSTAGRASVALAGAIALLLAAAPLDGRLAAAALAPAAALLLLNAPFYRFLARRRGLSFALRAIPWHWLYFLYSGAAFLAGVLRNAVRSGSGPVTPPPAG